MKVYAVIVNNGFYMEPDFRVYKVFKDRRNAVLCMNDLLNFDCDAFIEKYYVY